MFNRGKTTNWVKERDVQYQFKVIKTVMWSVTQNMSIVCVVTGQNYHYYK